MTDDDAKVLYQNLLEELRRHQSDSKPTDRDDYLKAIEAEIEGGKPVPVTLKVRGEKTVADAVAGKRQASTFSTGEFVQRQEYSSKEKLEILVNGLGLAIIAPPLMASKFASTINKLDKNDPNRSIHMSDDQSEEAIRSINASSTETTVSAVSGLRKLLDEIREEILEQSTPSSDALKS